MSSGAKSPPSFRNSGAVEVQTLPFPGFPTDLQAAFAVLLQRLTGEDDVLLLNSLRVGE